MASDVSQAFDHPEQRSLATATAPRDRISVRDHVVAVEIGAFQGERGQTQRLSFNVVVEVLSGQAGDDVDRILSYDTITEAIAATLGEMRMNLLETLADGVAGRILADPLAARCFVRIEKLDRGPGALGVEIVRDAAPGDAPADTDAPRPCVVHLSNAALAAPHLPTWIDRIARRGPAILCVGPLDDTAPQVQDTVARERIDLLSAEQNAWALAARDPRLTVMASRTELDWAMRQGHMAVWAPSKLVLDSVDRPADIGRDAPALAAWLAGRMGAVEILSIGADMPASAIPCRRVSLDDPELA